MHRIIAAAIAAFALSSGALAEEPTDSAAVRSFQFTYKFNVKEVPADAKSVKVWVPIPQNNAWQTISGLQNKSNAKPTTVTDTQYGNNFLLFDFTGTRPGQDGTYSAIVKYKVARKQLRPLDNPLALTGRTVDKPELMPRWLKPDVMVPLDGKIAAEAQKSSTGAKTTVEKARQLYDYIVDSVKYDKSGPAGTWGRGDAIYACDVRAGNCTDFHSLFIGEARSLGIPARFTIGFSVPNDKPSGDIGGYHCWAEFYEDTLGWVPIDASEASKAPGRKDELFGGLDDNRFDVSWGRDITLPGAAGGPVNFIIYPYVEVDGQKWDKFDKTFSYENL
jgi:transglutaminase-like putative cysteine protease